MDLGFVIYASKNPSRDVFWKRKKSVPLTWHKHTDKQTIFFHGTLLSVEGINGLNSIIQAHVCSFTTPLRHVKVLERSLTCSYVVCHSHTGLSHIIVILIEIGHYYTGKASKGYGDRMKKIRNFITKCYEMRWTILEQKKLWSTLKYCESTVRWGRPVKFPVQEIFCFSVCDRLAMMVFWCFSHRTRKKSSFQVDYWAQKRPKNHL